MQTSVTCEDKLINGIDMLSTEAINFISKTLVSPNRPNQILLEISGKFAPVEVGKLDSKNFLIQAKSLEDGTIKYFVYSEVNQKRKLEPFKENPSSKKKFRDSELSGSSWDDYGLVSPKKWFTNPIPLKNPEPTNLSGDKKDSPCASQSNSVIVLDKLSPLK
jgi:hypothetical protein